MDSTKEKKKFRSSLKQPMQQQIPLNNQFIKQELYAVYYINLLHTMFNNDRSTTQNISVYFDKILQYFIEQGITPIIMDSIMLQQEEIYIQQFDNIQQLSLLQPNQGRHSAVINMIIKNRSANIVGLVGYNPSIGQLESAIKKIESTKYIRQINNTIKTRDIYKYINQNYDKRVLFLLFPDYEISQISVFKSEQYKQLIIQQFFQIVYNYSIKKALKQQENLNKHINDTQKHREKKMLITNIKSIKLVNGLFMEFLKSIQSKTNLDLLKTKVLDLDNHQQAVIVFLNAYDLFVQYMHFLQKSEYQTFIKSSIQFINRGLNISTDNTETFHLRLLQMIYTKLYGYNPKIMQLKSKFDFFLAVPVDRVIVFEKQLEIYLKMKKQSSKCYHNNILLQLFDKKNDNEKRYQTLCQLMQEFSKQKYQQNIKMLLVEEISNQAERTITEQEYEENKCNVKQIPISFIECRKCDTEILCGHQALKILLYDKKDLYDTKIQNFTFLDSNISVSQFCCRFCGELLKSSQQLQQVENFDGSKKYSSYYRLFRTIYQKIQFEQVLNVYNIFKDLIVAIYQKVKQELQQYKESPDYSQKKMILQIIFICSYFKDIQGKYVSINYKKIFQNFQKDLPFNYNQFIEVVDKTYAKYKIKSLIFTQSQNIHDTIQILIKNKPFINNFIEQIYDIVVSKEGLDEVKLDLMQFYQIEEFKKYFTKTIFEIDKKDIQQILIAHAMCSSPLNTSQQTLVNSYILMKQQIALSQSNFGFHTPNNNYYQGKINQTDLYFPLALADKEELKQLNNEYYANIFYKQYCSIQINKLIKKKPDKKPDSDSLKQQRLTKKIDNKTIIEDPNTISVTINRVKQPTTTYEEILVKHNFVNNQCINCQYKQESSEVKFNKNEFLTQFFFIYNKQPFQKQNTQLQYIIPQESRKFERSHQHRQFEYDATFLVQFCVKNNIQHMRILNLGGLDYMDFSLIMQQKQIQAVLKLQIISFSARYGSFMKQRKGFELCQLKEIPEQLLFVKDILFDWSLFKDRYNKIMNYLKTIIIKLPISSKNIEYLRELNDFSKKIQDSSCRNYFILSQILIYFFFSQIYIHFQTAELQELSMQLLLQVLHQDEMFANKDASGVLYQKQRMRHQVVSVEEGFVEENGESYFERDGFIKREDEQKTADYDKELLNIRNNNDQDTEDEEDN